LTTARTLDIEFARTPEEKPPMSSEPIATTAAPIADTSERGLMIAVLVMVLLGAGAMLLMS
jgi:hypothetical protein